MLPLTIQYFHILCRAFCEGFVGHWRDTLSFLGKHTQHVPRRSGEDRAGSRRQRVDPPPTNKKAGSLNPSRTTLSTQVALQSEEQSDNICTTERALYMCICTCIGICIYVCVYMYIYIYIHIYTYTCIHILYVHTHACTHVHTHLHAHLHSTNMFMAPQASTTRPSRVRRSESRAGQHRLLDAGPGAALLLPRHARGLGLGRHARHRAS